MILWFVDLLQIYWKFSMGMLTLQNKSIGIGWLSVWYLEWIFTHIDLILLTYITYWKHTVHAHTQEAGQVCSGCVTVNDSTNKLTTGIQDLTRVPVTQSTVDVCSLHCTASCVYMWCLWWPQRTYTFILVFIKMTCSTACFKTCTTAQAVIALRELCKVVHTITDLPHFWVSMM